MPTPVAISVAAALVLLGVSTFRLSTMEDQSFDLILSKLQSLQQGIWKLVIEVENSLEF
jgi:hypothetical protein